MILRYALSKHIQHERDIAYRIYVTDTLKMIAENTAKLSQGTYREDRYCDIYNLETNQEVKTDEQVKSEILDEFERLGGGKRSESV